MAGMPRSIVKRAEEILKQLEADSQGISAKPIGEVGQSREGLQLSFFQLDDPVLSQIRDEIVRLDIDNMPPLEALKKLDEIRRIILGK
jgi:DNA mismatch repair protein MutS